VAQEDVVPSGVRAAVRRVTTTGVDHRAHDRVPAV